VARAEKAGVPAVMIGFADQKALGLQIALNNGEPNIRWVDAPRVGTGDERVSQIIGAVMKALTDPLTSKEKENGLYSPPPDARICFTGTLLDAQNFFHQTTIVQNCHNCPIDQWTDGLPIVIPTEEAVKEMMTGTSHKGDEQVFAYTMNSTSKQVVKGATAVTFYPMGWAVTVEKVAANAVMAGCKPEYMPVALAIASRGGGLPSSNGSWSNIVIVAGPISKEIGMNAGSGALNPGNQANSTIGRLNVILLANVAGAIQGVNRLDFGSPWNRGSAFAEDMEMLPPGWLGLQEEAGYKKTDSALAVFWGSGPFQGGQFAPSSYRGLQGEGYGGMARMMGVEGKKGPHNWLEYIVPILKIESVGTAQALGHRLLIFHSAMALDLYNYGFKSKADICDWFWKAGFISMGDFKKYGWYDMTTNSGTGIERYSGKKYNDLPDDYMVPGFGVTAQENWILVGMAPGDETALAIRGGRPGLQAIDPWR
jgi:hypothetical protein